MARKKAEKAEAAKEEAKKTGPVQRYVPPARVTERERQGWKRVEGATALRGGAVLMVKA